MSYSASKDLILVHTIQLQPMIKAPSGRMVSSGISDVVIVSVHAEKAHLKKLMKMMMMIIIIIMNKSQEMSFFSCCQKMTSAMKLKPEK